MSYIGRGIDQIDNISTLDNLTFNGSSATFNLTQNSVAFTPVSADALQIQIDGIIQSGNYTVSGSTVTFDFTPSGSSVCNGIKHFGVGVLSTPADGSVNMAQLGASGTKSSSTFLAGDNSFKTVSGTTINNNADNRVITGSGTANTLEGEAKLSFTSASLTVGNATAEDSKIIFDGNAQDYHIGIEDSSDSFVIGNNGFSTKCIVINDSAIVSKPNQPASLYTGNNASNLTGDGTQGTVGQSAGWGLTERWDNNGDSVDGIFTAPVTGKYLITGQVWIEGIASNHDNLTIAMETSNRTYYVSVNPSELPRASANSMGLPICALADMDANDTHVLKISVGGGSKVVDLVDLTTLGITLLC